MEKPTTLICACCGSPVLGRQFFNQDKGFGVCSDCFASEEKISGKTYTLKIFGRPGVNHSLDKTPEGFDPDLHGDALRCVGLKWKSYAELKTEIDKTTGYQTTCNGAFYILSNLKEWGYVEQLTEKIIKSGIQKGFKSSWRLNTQ